MPDNREQLWTLNIDTKVGDSKWKLSFTASEESIIKLVMTMWPAVEANLKAILESRPGTLQVGLADDALALLRCLVFRKFTEHNGKNIKIMKAA